MVAKQAETAEDGGEKHIQANGKKEITEEARKTVFDEFWRDTNWAQRTLYMAGQVDRDPVERSRAVGPQSRRTVSLRYHLLVDGERKQVCKNMFPSTLGIGEWSVLNWAQRAATQKSESNEKRLEKRPTVAQCPQQNPPPSACGNTVDVDQGECFSLLLYSFSLNMLGIFLTFFPEGLHVGTQMFALAIFPELFLPTPW